MQRSNAVVNREDLRAELETGSTTSLPEPGAIDTFHAPQVFSNGLTSGTAE
jgi:hypothetical protein